MIITESDQFRTLRRESAANAEYARLDCGQNSVCGSCILNVSVSPGCEFNRDFDVFLTEEQERVDFFQYNFCESRVWSPSEDMRGPFSASAATTAADERAAGAGTGGSAGHREGATGMQLRRPAQLVPPPRRVPQPVRPMANSGASGARTP